MNVKQLSKILMLFSVLLLFSGVTAGYTAFTVSAPATATYVSGYYTTTWTHAVDTNTEKYPLGLIATMSKTDNNTMSCYADRDSSGYTKTQTIGTGLPCCDKNNYKFSVAGWAGRPGGSYYLWCISDQNSDMNDFGKPTLFAKVWRK